MEPRSLPHIIHRQVLDLHLPPDRFDGNIEGQIKNLCYDALPEIDRVFSTFDVPGQNIRINKISVDLGRIEVDKLDELFLSRFREVLIETLHKIKLNNNDSTGNHQSDQIYQEQSQRRAVSFKEISEDEPLSPTVDDVKRSSTVEDIREAFLYFLDNGVYPWWMGGNIEQEAEKVFAAVVDDPSPVFIRQLKELCRHSSNALARLEYQFSNAFIQSIIYLLGQENGTEILALYEAVRRHYSGSVKAGVAKADASDKLITRLSLRLLVANDPIVAAGICIEHLERGLQQGIVAPGMIQQLLTETCFTAYSERLKQLLEKPAASHQQDSEESISEVLPVNEKESSFSPVKINDEKKSSARAEDKFDEPIDDFLYVDNAGLVLLHPFFSEFFFSLGLLDEQRQFTNEGSKTRAVYLLSFLATGTPDPSEHTLPFCKFLCDLPLKTAIEKLEDLSGYEKEECEQLLKAVITHWSALKNTSIDGLREGFLQRKGKLDFRESMTALIVEIKGQDVLLEGLPWGISYIQLPWLTDPFTTTWN